VLILGDAILGQIMEPVELPEPVSPGDLPEKPWATVGTGGKRKKNIVNSLYLQPERLEIHNLKLQKKWEKIRANEQRHAAYKLEDAKIAVAAYGSAARVCRRAVDVARDEGIPAGLLRPISLWPFPVKAFEEVAARVDAFLVVEMSLGQMIEDVRLATKCSRPVHFYGRTGGMVPTPAEVLGEIRKVNAELARSGATAAADPGRSSK
jgi:2-oxoglutarate ferredoxin oxidoreductase subunit alpha